jgi:predicted transcriptional regulator
MASVMVRVDPECRDLLRRISKETGKSAGVILREAMEDYRRKEFLRGVNEDFARLRKDKRAWKEELAERKAWDAVLLDGLEPE